MVPKFLNYVQHIFPGVGPPLGYGPENYNFGRLSDNLLQLEHHAGFKETEPISLRKMAIANIDLHVVLTKKSKPWASEGFFSGGRHSGFFPEGGQKW